MNVLVTGAGGFIGSHLAKELKEAGHFVRAVDIKWDDYIPRTELCHEDATLDLRDFYSCILATKDVDIVFNLAADMGGIGYITAIGADIMWNNSMINLNMLEASRINNIQRFFFSSSACIYPRYKQTEGKEYDRGWGLKEEDAFPAEPDEFYGWEKLYFELVCKAFVRDKGMTIRIARFHNIYGPQGTYDGGKEKAPAAICRKVALAKDGDAIEIWGDGSQTRSFCYIDDCVQGIMELMFSEVTEPVNIGSSELVTINELVDKVILISGKDLGRKYLLDKPQGVRGRNSDNTLFHSYFGWEPSIPLSVGLAHTYKWIQKELKNKVERSTPYATIEWRDHLGRNK